LKLDANALLAVTTVLALTLIVTVACALGPDGVAPKYIGAAAMSVFGFLFLNRLWMISRKRKPKALIQPDQPVTLIMAMTFPLAMVLSAALPLIAPNGDYGIMIIMAGVFTGLAIQSAAAARMAARG
jgi:uncharacterized membrane protein